MPGAALVLAAMAASAGDPPPDDREAEARSPHSHIHAHDEIDEEQGPLLVELTYTAEVMANVSGGKERGARYLDNLDLVVEADLEALAGWQGAQLHLYGLYNNGNSISDLVGDAQAVSNIETGVEAARLYEAWISQQIGDRLSLKAGLYDLNSEFDSLEASGLFVGSAHGIGTDISQSGLNGPSIFPSTSLALRIEGEFASRWKARAAILDGVPGDPAHPGRTAIRLGHGDGALAIAEIEAPLGDHGKLLLGHWLYTADFDAFDGGRGGGNSGTYLRGESRLLESGGRQLSGFFRLGVADGKYNPFSGFASVGLKLTGPFAKRPEDELGLAFASAITSDQFRRTAGAEGSEFSAELTYRGQVAPWLALQPSLHYIRNPGADPTIRDAVVAGLRAEFGFRL